MKDWKPTLLGDIGREIRNNYKPNKEESIPYLGYEHIEQQLLCLNGIGKSDDTQSGKKKFKNGDIVFGTLRPYFRKVVMPKFDGVCSSDLAVIRANKEYDQKFLFYILASQPLIDYADVTSNGTKMPRSKWSVLAQTEWYMPPLPTQRRIASILSAYDDLIEVNNQRIKLLEETALELYKEWFVRMRFPGHKEAKFVKGVPEGWEVKKLDDALSFKTGKLNSNASKEDGQYPFFTCSNSDFKTDTFSFDTEAVLLAGNNAAGVYPLKIFKGKFNAYQRTYIIKPKNNEVSHKYIYYYFFERLEFLQAISIGAATQFLTTQMLKKLNILLPAKKLMLKFSNIIDPMFEQIQTLQQQNTQLRQIRDRLLPRLISGKLELK